MGCKFFIIPFNVGRRWGSGKYWSSRDSSKSGDFAQRDLRSGIFAATKIPFQNKNEIKFSQSEILSISQEDLLEKIITKECRKLSSGGFDEIKKYYKKNFNTDISSISPGLMKM